MSSLTANAFGKVAVLMGGDSAERAVSLKSGTAVLQALKNLGVDAEAFDPKEQPLTALTNYARVFNTLHGRYGEDGCMQGVLEMLRIPYTGSGVMASALAMDKWRTKSLWYLNNIPTPAFEVLTDDSDWQAVVEKLGLPMFVKPANEGSSIGISKVKTVEELPKAYALAKASDPLVLAEAAIDAGEYTVSLLANDAGELTALPVVQIVPSNEFYDYDAKYISDDTRYFCPADLPEEKVARIQQEAIKAFELIGGKGWGRVDFLMDSAGQHYFLEANTSPGMTDHSLVPMAAKANGIDFETLVSMILERASVG